jgi:hypothetical protein
MDDKKIMLPSNYFCYQGSTGEKRTVYAQQETKWVFGNMGKVLPFENTDYYQIKQIRKRLSKDILIEYCTRLGIIHDLVMECREDGAFTYESYWEGKFADCKGFGSTELTRKALL